MPELPRHLLLVDDDPVVLRFMAAALAPHPDLRFATSGEEALRRLLQVKSRLNLLTNAVKYNRPGGAVEIGRDPAGQPVGSVGIAVRDSGQGMAPAQVDGLLQPFNRLGRQGSGQPGAGLGVGITRERVVALNGRLTVESTAAVGSCFTIVLPLAAADVDAARDTACPHDGPHA